MNQTVVIGCLRTTLDQSRKKTRWNRWRPTLSLFQHENLFIHRFELLYEKKFQDMADFVIADIHSISPATHVVPHIIEIKDAWDFENMYSVLFDFARHYPFNIEKEEYLIHITTGSHVTQICEFLLTESRYFPAKLIQTSPPKTDDGKNEYCIIDLDLSKYEKIVQRFKRKERENLSFLKSGIATKNINYNKLIEQIERATTNSNAPLLLTGPTGAGKSELAKRIYELKKIHNRIKGPFIEVNCATLRGTMAASTIFGHVKGAFNGATKDRLGLLREANEGVLFLDEIGELGIDEQAMLLKALEEQKFHPVGSDQEVSSKFQLIAGTNLDLSHEVDKGNFRTDLYSRINLWTFTLSALKDRPEDIDVNIDFELEKFSQTHHINITINKEAKEAYLKFATSGEALWKANFRDLNASMVRMATFADAATINKDLVQEEIERLKKLWKSGMDREEEKRLEHLLSQEQLQKLDRIERVQLIEIIKTCQAARNLSEAGRILYNASRTLKASTNDADRLKKFLARYNLSWDQIKDVSANN